MGGTGWLGGRVVAAALERGHPVSTLARGRRGHPPAGVRELVADRDDADEVGRALAGVEVDAVVDTSGYSVAGARSAAAHLAGVGAYAYVSSISAYRDWPSRPVRGTDDPTFTDDSDDYGPMKAASERVLGEALGDRLLVARAGLIIGPGDRSGRLAWWLRRLALGGPVVVPAGSLDQPVAFVDVRDLAGWLVDSVVGGRSGAVNATGDAGMTTYGGLLEVCRDTVGDDAREPVTWVPRDDDALLAAGVEPWTHLPFWLPAADAGAAWGVDTSSARTSGLPSRPVEETVRDLWAWLRADPTAPPAVPGAAASPGAPARSAPERPADPQRPVFGLPPAVEATLLR